jgi:hypothetical protein
MQPLSIEQSGRFDVEECHLLSEAHTQFEAIACRLHQEADTRDTDAERR